MFELPCPDWQQKTPANKTMAAFQEHFRSADLDRLSTATAGTAGYHSTTNQVTKTSTKPITHAANSITSNEEQIIANVVCTQVTLALAIMNTMPHNNNNNNNNSTPRPTLYCWSHGVTRNLRHTSQSWCNHHAEGHQEVATTDNKLGGSTRICGSLPQLAQRDSYQQHR
jgi:hypothetical protein